MFCSQHPSFCGEVALTKETTIAGPTVPTAKRDLITTPAQLLKVSDTPANLERRNWKSLATLIDKFLGVHYCVKQPARCGITGVLTKEKTIEGPTVPNGKRDATTISEMVTTETTIFGPTVSSSFLLKLVDANGFLESYHCVCHW